MKFSLLLRDISSQKRLIFAFNTTSLINERFIIIVVLNVVMDTLRRYKGILFITEPYDKKCPFASCHVNTPESSLLEIQILNYLICETQGKSKQCTTYHKYLDWRVEKMIELGLESKFLFSFSQA